MISDFPDAFCPVTTQRISIISPKIRADYTHNHAARAPRRLDAGYALRYIRWFTPHVLARTEGLGLRTDALRAGAESPRAAVRLGPGTYRRRGNRTRPARLAGKFRARHSSKQRRMVRHHSR